MSKNTNAAKRKPKRRKRPNPLASSILSDKAMIGCVEELMWGQFGCAILRACGIKPIDVSIAIQNAASDADLQGQKDDADAREGLSNSGGLAGTVNSPSPDALEEGKEKE